ncbi:hypothetical protein BZA77DRAFT_317926 [Pyronema omphalodes]|nr:hypothetical protein BZA77DRAFT_317926 [Pyronema omphalodes]
MHSSKQMRVPIVIALYDFFLYTAACTYFESFIFRLPFPSSSSLPSLLPFHFFLATSNNITSVIHPDLQNKMRPLTIFDQLLISLSPLFYLLPCVTPTPVFAPLENPLVFLDFDGTIATTDAFELLPETAYKTLPFNESFPHWSYFSEAYLSDYSLAVASTPLEPRTIEQEMAHQSSPSLRQAELDSFTRVKESGIMNTTSPRLLHKAAKQVTIRNGFYDFIQAAQSRSVPVSIISRNWSAKWIRTILRVNAPPGVCGHVGCVFDAIDRMDIFSPEILPQDCGSCNERNHDTPIFSGEDKREVMRGFAQNGQVVFVGDENSDLAPILLEPTMVGVVAGKDAEAAKIIGKERELWDAKKGWRGFTRKGEGIYLIEDYNELMTLFGWDGIGAEENIVDTGVEWTPVDPKEIYDGPDDMLDKVGQCDDEVVNMVKMEVAPYGKRTLSCYV